MRHRLGVSGAASLPVLLALALIASTAVAAEPGGAVAKAPPTIAIEAQPLVGAAPSFGWNGFTVRVRNDGAKPVRGDIAVECRAYSSSAGVFRATAPYAVAGGASVVVRIPAIVPSYSDVSVHISADNGDEIAPVRFSGSGHEGVSLIDAMGGDSVMRAALNEAPITTSYALPTTGWSGRGGSSPVLSVAQLRVDPTTGDPILPDRAALWGTADVVMMRSDILTALKGPELDALAGWVLAGGTIAVVLQRPEDVGHPTLEALAGGPIHATRVSPVTLRELTLEDRKGSPSPRHAAAPTKAVAETLGGYEGGNLHASAYGASATYGLGELHILAFDPSRKPGVDDPWAQIRVIDLARAAFERRATLVFRLGGGEPASNDYQGVRQELDPNQSSRWAIGVAALLLCLYAVLAGPVNFTLASRKQKPLQALWRLPIASALAFAVIVGVGIAAKGVFGRARHLTLVEAGAGMSMGGARRFRGFFASRAKDLTVHTTDASSVLSMAILAETAEPVDHLIVDRDGARLVDVAALPWQTVVAREDGFASLGRGVAIVRDGEDALTVVNRTGRDLRSVIVMLPDRSAVYAPKLADGEKLSSKSTTSVNRLANGSAWLGEVTAPPAGGAHANVHALHADMLRSFVERDAPGLPEAWIAIQDAAGAETVDWFPAGVPVLIAQIDGGEARRRTPSDSGLRLERDRLLVRVVGFGGEP